MRFFFLILTFCLMLFPELNAQEKIQLSSKDPKNKQTVNIKLHDSNNGNLLMNLPLTFHIMKGKERNILFMIVGKEKNNQNIHTVWMIRSPLKLDELLKKNRNLKIGKDFKKSNELIEPFYEKSENISLIDFPDEFEMVGSAPKPIFFEVREIDKPFELKLKFYISMPDKDETIQVLTAKSGMVRVTFDITN